MIDMIKKMLGMLVITIILITTIVYAFESELDPFPPSAPSEVYEPVGSILGAIHYVGYAIAIGMLIYIGIRYTMAAANEKADLKQMSVNYAIGAFIIAGASGLFQLIYQFLLSARQ